MNAVEEILQAISIALLVAEFLVNASHALKAIELCKESLVLLNDKVLRIEKGLSQIMYQMIYIIMFRTPCKRSYKGNSVRQETSRHTP